MQAGVGMRRAVAMVAALGILLAGCGEGEGVSYGDAKIIDKLNLKKSGNGYAIDGDPFCEVEGKLLNDCG